MKRPDIVPFVKAACEQAMHWYDADVTKLGKSRMSIGNAIRLMCRAPKSREGDHFAASVGWAAILEGFMPTIPDWCLDGHTTEGRRKGRGVEYFREVSTELVPPADKDAYEDEAFRLLALESSARRAQHCLTSDAMMKFTTVLLALLAAGVVQSGCWRSQAVLPASSRWHMRCATRRTAA